MYKLTFYGDNIGPNVLKRPSARLYECDAVLKAGASFLSPVFSLLSADFSPVSARYVYVSIWDRYYIIQDVATMAAGRYVVSLSVDVLKSFADDILATYQYCIRGNLRTNGHITDTKYPITAHTTISSVELQPIFSDALTFASGYYVIGVQAAGAAQGGVQYYSMTAGEFAALCTAATNGTYDLASIQGWTDLAVKAFTDPFKYLVSAMFFPLDLSGGGRRTNVVWGPYGQLSTVTGRLLSYNYYTAGVRTATLPKHPQSARGAYLNNAPYTTYILNIPPFGSVSLAADKLVNAATISATVTLDLISGLGLLRVTAGGEIVAESAAPCGIPVAVSRMNIIRDTLSSVGNMARAAYTHSAVSAANAVGGYIDAAISPDISTVGGMGGTSAFGYKPVLQATFHNVADDAPAKYGRPVCKYGVLSSFGNFIQCDKSHVEIATAAENSMIEKYLNEGVYVNE